MNPLKCLNGLGLITLGILMLNWTASAGADQKASKTPHGSMEKCAKACADCMRECESCARHFAHEVAHGHKDHLRTLGTCADCAEVCASAAKIVSRSGPFAKTICDSCARACDQCGTACEKFSDDKHMARCARACRECAKACRDMVKHANHKDTE